MTIACLDDQPARRGPPLDLSSLFNVLEHDEAHRISKHREFCGTFILARFVDALANGLDISGMAMPTDRPEGLRDTFAGDPVKQAQRKAFLRKNRLDQAELPDVIARLRDGFAKLGTR